MRHENNGAENLEVNHIATAMNLPQWCQNNNNNNGKDSNRIGMISRIEKQDYVKS